MLKESGAVKGETVTSIKYSYAKGRHRFMVSPSPFVKSHAFGATVHAGVRGAARTPGRVKGRQSLAAGGIPYAEPQGMPYFLSLAYRVERFILSRVSAPLGPRTRPSVRSMMWRR